MFHHIKSMTVKRHSLLKDSAVSQVTKEVFSTFFYKNDVGLGPPGRQVDFFSFWRHSSTLQPLCSNNFCYYTTHTTTTIVPATLDCQLYLIAVNSMLIMLILNVFLEACLSWQLMGPACSRNILFWMSITIQKRPGQKFISVLLKCTFATYKYLRLSEFLPISSHILSAGGLFLSFSSYKCPNKAKRLYFLFL